MAQKVRLTGLPAMIQLQPGGRQRLTLAVTNTSLIVDQFTLSVSGLAEEWYSLASTAVSLMPGTSGSIELSLHPPTSSLAGEYPVEVAVVSQAEQHVVVSAASIIGVASTGRLAIEVRPLAAEGRGTTFQVVWQNLSNSEASVELATRDAENGLRFLIDPEGAVRVPPGGESTVAVEVHPLHEEMVGDPHPYEIEFRGLRPGSEDLLDAGLKRQAHFTYVPRIRTLMLPAWLRRLPIWALLLLLLLLLSLVFMAGNRTGGVIAQAGQATATVTAAPASTATPSPRPTAVPTASVTMVPLPAVHAFGMRVGAAGAIRLAWTVMGANQVYLNGRPVAPDGSLPIRVTKPTLMLLKASNGSGTITQLLQVVPPPTRRIAIVQPPKRINVPAIRSFTAQDDPHTGALILRWQVLGADVVLLNKAQVAATSTKQIGAGGPASYVLRARNAAGMTTKALVLPAAPPVQVRTVLIRLPAIQSFTLRHFRDGQPYQLIWRTADATGVTLNGQPVASDGNRPLSAPIQNTHFVLVARNAAGQAVANLQAVVQ